MIWKQLNNYLSIIYNLSIIFKHLIIEIIELINFGTE